ncbi:DUF294 nucleotidyltransferase-like domain-containing protein [Tepidibacillus fermentans]|uniref:CBS domain-containing protein n=1 Tax=Tepidibacillus fermentans TaxID=1281767 RepID=A0A4R3KGR3_9BACI|nr:DUF294 nucleotidyltransferase-like domain-containing protein [Tepidibacillus fermentans]TCS82537.1 CBS domain-containing protein [Tepidibacillus fermentans]
MENSLLPFLKGIPLFSHLPDEDIQKIISVSKQARFTDHQIVVNQNDKQIDHLFVVLNGLAKNIIINEDQEEITIKTYGKGEVFGLIHAMSGEGFSYTIRAAHEVEFLLVPLTIFESLMSKYPFFMEEVARLITLRLRELYKQLEKETSIAFSSIQGSPYRKKVIEFMSQPILTCQKDDYLLEIAQTILDQRVGSIIVLNEHQSPIGIITEKDLIKAFTTLYQYHQGRECKTFVQAEEVMTSPLITISPDAFYYDALHLMLKHNIKHLPVVDQETVIGIVSTKNLIHSFSNHSFRLIKEIESTTSLEELLPMKSQVNQMLQEMIQQHATPKELAAIITEMNERVTKKIISFAEKEMIRDGYGTPPVSFCWLSLGSEGRKEQTLQTDQDNAIVYADVPEKEEEKVDQYFTKLAEKIVTYLDQYGFPKCTGGVMATNPKWRKSLSQWINSIHLWYQKRSPDMIRQFTIFFDFRPIYGDYYLAEQIRNVFLDQSQPPIFLHLLAEDESRIEVPINRFGRFITRKGEHQGKIDMKHGGILHIINGLRMLAFKYGIMETSSWERIEALKEKGILTFDEADEITQAFDDFIILRIKYVDSFIDPHHLSKKERIQLKKALMTARWFQQWSIRHLAMPGSHLRGF